MDLVPPMFDKMSYYKGEALSIHHTYLYKKDIDFSILSHFRPLFSEVQRIWFFCRAAYPFAYLLGKVALAFVLQNPPGFTAYNSVYYNACKSFVERFPETWILHSYFLM
jgi:hypothetical protein